MRHKITDAAMCAVMNAVQWRHRRNSCSAAEFEAYLTRCEPLSRFTFYSCPEPASPLIESTTTRTIEWQSPVQLGYPRNDKAFAEIFPAPRPQESPVVIVLHALMSASRVGYWQLAKRFNRAGWTCVFPHLPFHYRRRIPGCLNGELAISAHLIRNGEVLRQSVCEVRQVIASLKAIGIPGVGIWGTSFGGWIGALTAAVEPRLEFVVLQQPIVDVDHAIWENPCAVSLRRIVDSNGITRASSSRHSHLSSPLMQTPACDPSVIRLVGGRHDRICTPEKLAQLSEAWGVQEPWLVDQGHFGYAAAAAAIQTVQPFLGRTIAIG